MSFFAASPFLKALGWGLFHSLWQFAICWLIYRMLTTGIKKITAPARHTMAVLLLFAGTASFIAGFSWKYYADTATSGYPDISIANTSYYTLWHSADKAIDILIPYWSLLYLLCVTFLLIKFCLFVRRAGSLQHRGITKMTAVWRTYVQSIAARLGIHKEVKALLSVHIDTPQVIGFFKPVILLPAACLVNLTTEQLEAVLLHELVHIKRNDYLVNVFVTSIEILFFFNPFVKQLTAGIRREREYSCDDMVIQFQYHPHNYASALLTLEKSRLLPVTYGIAASGRNHQQLLTRIERIMGIENRQTGLYRLGACLMALLLLGFIATINPAKVALSNFAPIHAAMLFTDDDNNATPPPPPVSNEQGKLLITGNGSPHIAIKMENKLVRTTSPADVLAKIDRAFTKTLQLESVASEDNDEDGDQAQTAASRENIDFSLPQKETPLVPEAELAGNAMPEPYVPASSFSFQLTQDTVIAKRKGETYNERMAKDAFLKVQKAMQQINWQRIEKQLKFNRKDIAKLKNELVLQIRKLNWQQINNDVKLQTNLDQIEKIQEALKQKEVIKQYQLTEAYHEAMARQLTEQEQLLKETEQRQEEARKAAELQLQRLQAEMKKRRIIYL